MGVFRRKFNVEVYANDWTESLQLLTRVYGPHTTMSGHFALAEGAISSPKGMFRMRLSPLDDGAVFIGGRQPGAAVIPHGEPMSAATSALPLGDVAAQYDQGRPQDNVLTVPFTLEMFATLFTSLGDKGDRGFGSAVLTTTAMTANAEYCKQLSAAIRTLGGKALNPGSLEPQDWRALPTEKFYLFPAQPVTGVSQDPAVRALERLYVVGSLARVCFGGLDLRNDQDPVALRWWMHDQLLLELAAEPSGGLTWSAWYVSPGISNTEPQIRRKRYPLATEPVHVSSPDPAMALRALLDDMVPQLHAEPAHLLAGGAADISPNIDFWVAIRNMALTSLGDRATRVAELLETGAPEQEFAELGAR